MCGALRKQNKTIKVKVGLSKIFKTIVRIWQALERKFWNDCDPSILVRGPGCYQLNLAYFIKRKFLRNVLYIFNYWNKKGDEFYTISHYKSQREIKIIMTKAKNIIVIYGNTI